MTIYLPHVAVQHSSGCPKDMGMCIVQAGTILGLMWTLLMRTLLKTKVLPGWRVQDMDAAVAGAWLRWLPSSLLPGIRGLDLLSDSLCRQQLLQFERGLNVQKVFVSYGGYPD